MCTMTRQKFWGFFGCGVFSLSVCVSVLVISDSSVDTQFFASGYTVILRVDLPSFEYEGREHEGVGTVEAKQWQIHKL